MNITPEKIRQAANECPEAAKTLKTLFPEAFEDEFYNFLEGNILDANVGGKPLFIGRGLAPERLDGKCLIVDPDYRMETMEYDGRTILYFKKK